ncbi:hypothetical protein PMAYCL1PPCAC_10853, partial [Pristionchus mayeri]
VREKLYFLIDTLFKNAGSEYLVVQGNYVRYDRNNMSTTGIIDFILKNSFAYYGGQLYQQYKGIPQGNNASPQIADLTLAIMEYQYIRNNIKVGHTLAFSLNRTFRYIDALFHISDSHSEFTNSGKAQISLYNKTDDYSFSVVRYPHFESNIPRYMGANTMHGEIIRIYRNCSSIENFLDRVRKLVKYFILIQYPKDIVFSRLYKSLNR